MGTRRTKSLFASLLGLGMAGPIVLALFVAALQSYQQADLVGGWVETELRETGTALANDPTLLSHYKESARQARIRLTLLDENGAVISDTGGLASGTSLVNEADVYLARTVEHGMLREVRDGIDTTFFCQSLSIRHHPISLLRVSTPTFALTHRSSGSDVPGQLVKSVWFWLISLGFTLFSTVLAIISVRRIRKPLLKATSALTNLGELSWESRLDVGGRGEVADLGVAFNRAVGTLGTEFTRLEQRSQDLEQSARFLETVLGAMVEGVLVVDGRQAVTYANTAAGMLLGSRFQPAQMTGRQVLEVVRNQTIDRTVRAILEGQDRIRVELELSSVQRTLSLFATRLAGGPSPGAVLVLHDITELRRLERLRREFVSNVSHELKTPLAAIQAYVETLLDGAAEDPTARTRFLKGIEGQSERLNQLIQDLLRLARIESGNEEFDIREFDATSSIQEIVEQNQALAVAKHIEVSIAEAPAIWIKSDEKSFRTIIENLLTNAVKYTSEGGRIQISIRDDGNRFARIDIADNGIGISSEHQPRVFERFYRVDEARSRDVGGTGLGLSIVKHLCQVFGGSVAVRSECGVGSTFTVMLPLA